jgi:hypothetical protein
MIVMFFCDMCSHVFIYFVFIVNGFTSLPFFKYVVFFRLTKQEITVINKVFVICIKINK